jgi:hypothetical protein
MMMRQSRWRGYRTRCDRQARREVEVRRRVAAANAWARLHPERTLGRRTRAALPVLLRGASGAGEGRVGELLEACEALEVATRQSAVCCAMVADRAALPILVTFIRSCNRSQPHMQLVRASPALSVPPPPLIIRALSSRCLYTARQPHAAHNGTTGAEGWGVDFGETVFRVRRCDTRFTSCGTCAGTRRS